MPEIPPAVKTRLQAWWSGLEGGTQAIFEAIYMEAPAAVSRAISGGEWVADAPEPGLAAQLGSDHGAAAAEQIPLVVATDAVQVTPFHATPGQKVRIDWTERNASRVQLDSYFTDIYVQDPDGQTVGSGRLTNAALAPEAEAPRTFEFQGAQAAGEYSVMIYINAEGADQGSGVAGPQGYRSTAGTRFSVGTSEVQAGMQDTQAWGMGTQTIASARSAISVLEQLQRVQEGVNWLAATDQLEEQEKTVLGDIGTRLAGSLPRLEMDEQLQKPDSLTIEGLAPYRAALDQLAGAAQSPEGWSAAGRRPVIDALTNLLGVLPQ